MKRFLSHSIIFILLLSTQFLHAQENNLAISTIIYPPMAIDTERGIVIELAAEAFSRIDVNVKFKAYPWARALASAIKGETAAITPVFRTKEREQLLHFPDTPLYTLEMVLFMKTSETDMFDGTPNSLAGRSVSFVNGTQLTEDFDKAKTDGRLVAQIALSLEEQLKMVDAGRVEFAVAERMAGLQMLGRLGVSNEFKVAVIPVVSRGVYIGLSRQSSSKQEAEQLDLAIKSLQADGSYSQILKKYSNIN